ncbi:HutD family protein [Clostridium thailandense]|uniref:HutD/Ves family protein n=1 Tax=Clostridium thailandense TaxID=2794346 RepID=UPI0039892778
MENKISIIKKSKFQVSEWSGGTTTELLIYPEDAKYSDRSFKWRLSSAKVEAEESIFTHLPGISRIIMVIDGVLRLEHEGHHKVILNPFEQDSFMGSWKTKSFGKVTDFNLMMNEGCIGKLEAFSINDNIKIFLDEISEETNQVTDAFYCVEGDFQLTIGNELLNVNKDEILEVTRYSDEIHNNEIKICNKGSQKAKVIKATIFCQS